MKRSSQIIGVVLLLIAAAMLTIPAIAISQGGSLAWLIPVILGLVVTFQGARFLYWGITWPVDGDVR